MSTGIIKHDRVRVQTQAARERQASESCEKAARILEREGRPVAIELRCSCGELTVLELDYADPPKPPVS